MMSACLNKQVTFTASSKSKKKKMNLLDGHNKSLRYFSSKGDGNSLNGKQEL